MITDWVNILILEKQKLFMEDPISSAIRQLPSEKRLSFDVRINRLIEDIPFPEDFTRKELKSVMIDELKMFLMDRIREIEVLIENVVNDRSNYNHDDETLAAHNLDLAAHNLDELYLSLNSSFNDCNLALNKLVNYEECIMGDKEMYVEENVRKIKDLAVKKGIKISDGRAMEIAEHFKDSDFNNADVSEEIDNTVDDWEIPDERN